MNLPDMKYRDRITKNKQIKFGGLNLSCGADDGELCAMKNLTSDHYPLVSTRQPRLHYGSLDNPGGLFSWDGLAWVDGTKFYFRGTERGTVTEGKKTFANMGAYIVIFPDKCYYNIDTEEFGSLEAKWQGPSLTFSNGLLYEEEAEANTIRCDGVIWEDYFRIGDAVSISGCELHRENNVQIIIRAIDGDKLYFYENSFTLGTDTTQYTENGALSISRTVPDLLYLCENENRLWGCTQTTIYACKWNDIFNWNVYDGLEDDSYAVTPSSAGIFTGCISYGGYPVFFKEDVIYKVYGSVKTDFAVLGSASLGIAKGSEHSLAVAGETLFYLSRNGVMAYTGGIPQPMSAAFGTNRFKNGVGGSDGLKYYISMEGSQGDWGLFVYDTQKGMWHQEDNTHAMQFTRWAGNLYCLDANGSIFLTGNAQEPPEGVVEETDIQWEAEFADFTDEGPNKKGVSKLQLRLEIREGDSVTVWLMFDSDGQWQKVSSVIGEGKKRSYYLPIVPRRCDHYRLKLTGTGHCKIASLVRECYSGSELKTKYGRN